MRTTRHDRSRDKEMGARARLPSSHRHIEPRETRDGFHPRTPPREVWSPPPSRDARPDRPPSALSGSPGAFGSNTLTRRKQEARLVPTWMALQHRASGAAVDADTLAIGGEAAASGVPPGAAAARPKRKPGLGAGRPSRCSG